MTVGGRIGVHAPEDVLAHAAHDPVADTGWHAARGDHAVLADGIHVVVAVDHPAAPVARALPAVHDRVHPFVLARIGAIGGRDAGSIIHDHPVGEHQGARLDVLLPLDLEVGGGIAQV